ncbi:MAG: AAA family ATPase [Gammaproteobacteria bacterium]|nr:AAA family ATPase [Gammaproteobacteria bacterium]
MRLPTWEEFEGEQLEVLELPLNQSLFVVGPPGSGKTVLAMRRAQMVANAKADTAQDDASVTVVTFNRMLKRLLALHLARQKQSGIDVYTMHSFISYDYCDRMKESPPSLTEYMYDWDLMLRQLEEMNASPNKAHLVIDEGQDLPQMFFRYASRYVANTMTVFADENQALEEQHTTLEQIKAATGLDDPLILEKNHRNTPEVARLAEHFHGGRLPAATVRRASSRELPRLVRSANLQVTANLVSNWFNNRGGSIGVIVWQNKVGGDLQRELAKKLSGTRVDRYDYKNKNESGINMLAPGVTILNTRSVKGQEFDTVFILELERFIPCTDDVKRRTMYMMCARARDNLFLVYGPGVLTASASKALPKSDILERT